jgi:hypothetical protein
MRRGPNCLGASLSAAAMSMTAMFFASNQLDAGNSTYNKSLSKISNQQIYKQDRSPESPEKSSVDEQNLSAANIDQLSIQAARADVMAIYELGVLYFHGKGVKQNYLEAYKLFDRAAREGLGKAQFAAMAVRAMGQQHDPSGNANKKNFDLENCPDKASVGQYVSAFTNYKRSQDQLNEWPNSFEYFVVADPRQEAQEEAKKLFAAAEEIRAKRLRGALARGDTRGMVGSILGSDEEWKLAQRATELQNKAQAKIDYATTFAQKRKEEKPIGHCILSDYQEIGTDAEKNYQLRSICVNNFTAKTFDPTRGMIDEVDANGNLQKIKSFEGFGSDSDIFLPQDKAGNSFVLGDTLSIADLIDVRDVELDDAMSASAEGSIDSRIELSQKFFSSGKGTQSGKVTQFGGIPFSRAGKDFILVFKKFRYGLYCSYQRAQSLSF